MQKYIKVYLDYFDIKTENELICERCGAKGNDLYHIYGRGKGKDVIENIMCLCRDCHLLAHGSKNYISKAEFQEIHNNFLK